LWQMTHFSPQMDQWPVIISGVVQGVGTGAVYVPMAALAFATLSAQLRNEGAAMFNLMRNIGSSVGISVVQALFASNSQVIHSSLVGHITPYNLAARNPQLAAQLASPDGAAVLNARLSDQASMIAYLDDFQLMLILTVLAMPLLLLVRKARAQPAGPQVAAE
jgi:DHA2 family multidrug resistance protein